MDDGWNLAGGYAATLDDRSRIAVYALETGRIGTLSPPGRTAWLTGVAFLSPSEIGVVPQCLATSPPEAATLRIVRSDAIASNEERVSPSFASDPRAHVERHHGAPLRAPGRRPRRATPLAAQAPSAQVVGGRRRGGRPGGAFAAQAAR